MSDKRKAAWTPERKAAHAEMLRKRWSEPGRKEAHSRLMKEYWSDPENVEKQSLIYGPRAAGVPRKHKHARTGVPRTPEEKAKIAASVNAYYDRRKRFLKGPEE